MSQKTRTRWLLGLGALTTVLFAQPYRPLVILGESMEPTYADRTLVLTTPPGSLHRGDVVVFRTPDGELMIKRVAFIEGDPLWQVHTFGGWQTVVRCLKKRRRSARARIAAVPKGHIFVLGDNYARSTDSRDLGFIPVSSVLRKVANPKPHQAETPALVAELDSHSFH